jgi:aspartyl-tRNA(Asn)/glutamyl-tRNA(Gln) amidotransferase subunit A
VAAGYSEALSGLSAAGVTLVDVAFPELAEIPHLYRQGGLAAAEAYAWHQELLATRGDEYDQRIRTRIEPGRAASAAYYIEVLEGRKRLISLAERNLAGLDAYVLPTVVTVPPSIASFDSGDRDYYTEQNLLALRNTSVGNFLDTCSISVPVRGADDAPVGVMLMGRPMGDRDMLHAARTVERLCRERR